MAVALLVGVATGVWLPMPIGVVRVVLGVVWVATVAAASLRAAPLALVVLLVAGFTTSGLLLGATRHVAALETPLARWFDDQPGAAGGRVGPVLIEGRLRADATPTDYGVTLRLMVERIGRADLLRPTSGGVRLSVGGRRWSGRMAGSRCAATPAPMSRAATARGRRLPRPPEKAAVEGMA